MNSNIIYVTLIILGVVVILRSANRLNDSYEMTFIDEKSYMELLYRWRIMDEWLMIFISFGFITFNMLVICFNIYS